MILVFGNEDYTVLVNGVYPEGAIFIEPTIELKIKLSLLSTVYDDLQDENPLDAATFMIDIVGTDFKLIKYMSGSLIYSTDGEIPTEKPTLIVGNSLSKIPLQNQREYAEERIKNLLNLEESKVIEVNEVTIDKMQGFEIIANGENKENKAKLAY